MTPLVIPDASVILKWVLDAEDEPFQDAAFAILDSWNEERLELLVPSLWLYEVGNILCLKRPQDAVDVLAALRALDLPEVPLDGNLAEEAAQVAIGFGVTLYDASYLALARLNEGTLVTADKRFLGRLPEGAPARSLEGWIPGSADR